VLVIFVVASCLTLINIGSLIAFNIITSLGTGTLTSSYIICIATLVWRKVTGQPLLPSRFDMGRITGLCINIVALLWLCLTLIIAFFPGIPISAGLTAATMNWAVVVWAGVILFAIVFFFVWARRSYDGPVEYVRKLD
jgi:choline transport protein